MKTPKKFLEGLLNQMAVLANIWEGEALDEKKYDKSFCLGKVHTAKMVKDSIAQFLQKHVKNENT